jgi:hypothetical protein
MTLQETVIAPYYSFVLKSKYHEGVFIIFEEDGYWYGHINAFHASHALSKALLGSKLNDYIVADLGLGIYDAYQITQIKKAPRYTLQTETRNEITEVGSHRQRWSDGARERWVFKAIQPETTFSVLYQELKANSRSIRLRDLRKPLSKPQIQVKEQRNTVMPTKAYHPKQVDKEQTRAINILEISELTLGMAIREANLESITFALQDAENVLETIEQKFYELPRCKSLQKRITEAKKWIERN